MAVACYCVSLWCGVVVRCCLLLLIFVHWYFCGSMLFVGRCLLGFVAAGFDCVLLVVVDLCCRIGFDCDLCFVIVGVCSCVSFLFLSVLECALLSLLAVVCYCCGELFVWYLLCVFCLVFVVCHY